MTWGEVPKGFVHGILQGYRVFYKRTGDKNDSYANSTTGPNERKLHITGLKKFTKYSVKVLAVTRKGDGAVSVNISVLTDEDGRLFKLSNFKRMVPAFNFLYSWYMSVFVKLRYLVQ